MNTMIASIMIAMDQIRSTVPELVNGSNFVMRSIISFVSMIFFGIYIYILILMTFYSSIVYLRCAVVHHAMHYLHIITLICILYKNIIYYYM